MYVYNTIYLNSGFSYKDSAGKVTSLSGTASFTEDNCYEKVKGGKYTLQSNLLDVLYNTLLDADGQVTGFRAHGYVNPKYVILAVTYAPPGSKSYAQYTQSITTSSTIDGKSTFSDTYQQSVTTNVNVTIKGWSAGASATTTNTYTQSAFTSFSTTVSKTKSLTDNTPGPSDDYRGLNHDYDVVWIWLNPVQLFTLVMDSNYNLLNVELNGYGFSTLDQPNMEVYPVYVGWLNGDIPMTPDQAKPLQRAWAAGEIWPGGQGPALTTADLHNIVQVDPYWQCTPNPSACPTTVDGTRYTQTLNQDIIYQQAPVGGQPITESYTDTYSTISQQGTGGSFTYSQAYAWESAFSGSLFFVKFGSTLKVSNELKWQNEWDRYLTSTDTDTGTVSITGPPCVVILSVCNPTYNGTTEFSVYEDGLFGTFMLFPRN